MQVCLLHRILPCTSASCWLCLAYCTAVPAPSIGIGDWLCMWHVHRAMCFGVFCQDCNTILSGKNALCKLICGIHSEGPKGVLMGSSVSTILEFCHDWKRQGAVRETVTGPEVRENCQRWLAMARCQSSVPDVFFYPSRKTQSGRNPQWEGDILNTDCFSGLWRRMVLARDIAFLAFPFDVSYG